MGTIRSIVVGLGELDESPQLSHAAELAESLGARLHIVHAYHLPDPALFPFAEMSVIRPEALNDIRRRVQAAVEEHAARVCGTAAVKCRAVALPAAMAILETAREVEADLVLVGATRHGAVARAVLGTTAQRVLRGAAVPVLLSRRPGGRMRRVLLTTDLSDLSAHVHDRAVALAAELTAATADGHAASRDYAARSEAPGAKAEAPDVTGEEHSLLAEEPSGAMELRSLLVVDFDVPLMPPPDAGVLAEAGERRLAEFLAGRPADAGRVEARVRVGDPPREIVAEAEQWGADLLVLGTHGRSGATRLLVGSVAESVMRHAPCDILAIPASALSGAAEADGAHG